MKKQNAASSKRTWLSPLNHILPWLCVIIFFHTSNSQAAFMDSYDLDSLVSMSEEIVEGEFSKKGDEIDGLELAQIRIQEVHKGTFKKDRIITVAGLSGYRKSYPPDPLMNSTPFEVGDHFILFLARANDITREEVYRIIPSGLKWIRNGMVLSFMQFNNPGPYLPILDETSQKKSPPIELFRNQLHQSMQRTDELHRQFKQRTKIQDVPWLLQFIRKKNLPFSTRDHIAELACANLANLHDPTVLSNVLRLELSFSCQEMIKRGFGTVAGREFLLKKIGDMRQALKDRIHYALLLKEAGEIYHSSFNHIGLGSWDTSGSPVEGNAHYIARVAKLTLENAKNESLVLSLLESMDYFVRAARQELRQDVMEALGILKKLYDSTSSEPVKFKIEVITAHGSPSSYQDLNSPCGPLISLLNPETSPQEAKSAPTQLTFQFLVDTFLTNEKSQWIPSIVLVSQNSGRTYQIPSQKKFIGHGSEQGHETVALPANLPSGRYRIFYQFTPENDAISNGHYFEANL